MKNKKKKIVRMSVINKIRLVKFEQLKDIACAFVFAFISKTDYTCDEINFAIERYFIENDLLENIKKWRNNEIDIKYWIVSSQEADRVVRENRQKVFQ